MPLPFIIFTILWGLLVLLQWVWPRFWMLLGVGPAQNPLSAAARGRRRDNSGNSSSNSGLGGLGGGAGIFSNLGFPMPLMSCSNQQIPSSIASTPVEMTVKPISPRRNTLLSSRFYPIGYCTLIAHGAALITSAALAPPEHQLGIAILSGFIGVLDFVSLLLSFSNRHHGLGCVLLQFLLLIWPIATLFLSTPSFPSPPSDSNQPAKVGTSHTMVLLHFLSVIGWGFVSAALGLVFGLSRRTQKLMTLAYLGAICGCAHWVYENHKDSAALPFPSSNTEAAYLIVYLVLPLALVVFVTPLARGRYAQGLWSSLGGWGDDLDQFGNGGAAGRATELILDLTQENAQLKKKAGCVSSLAHEVRTPLNALLSCCTLLTDTGLTADQMEYVNMMLSCGSQITTNIDYVLELARLEQHKVSLCTDPMDVLEVCRSAVEMVQHLADKKQLTLSCDCDIQSSMMVIGDAGRIRQVLINLLSNSIKFTPSGSVVLSVLLTPTSSTDLNSTTHSSALVQAVTAGGSGSEQPPLASVLLQIYDTGIGLSPEQQARLFVPFQQADSTTWGKYGGSGLGLAICQELVNLMGGTIKINAERTRPGHGTCIDVQLFLPLAPATRLSASVGRRSCSPHLTSRQTPEDSRPSFHSLRRLSAHSGAGPPLGATSGFFFTGENQDANDSFAFNQNQHLINTINNGGSRSQGPPPRPSTSFYRPTNLAGGGGGAVSVAPNFYTNSPPMGPLSVMGPFTTSMMLVAGNKTTSFRSTRGASTAAGGSGNLSAAGAGRLVCNSFDEEALNLQTRESTTDDTNLSSSNPTLRPLPLAMVSGTASPIEGSGPGPGVPTSLSGDVASNPTHSDARTSSAASNPNWTTSQASPIAGPSAPVTISPARPHTAPEFLVTVPSYPLTSNASQDQLIPAAPQPVPVPPPFRMNSSHSSRLNHTKTASSLDGGGTMGGSSFGRAISGLSGEGGAAASPLSFKPSPPLNHAGGGGGGGGMSVLSLNRGPIASQQQHTQPLPPVTLPDTRLNRFGAMVVDDNEISGILTSRLLTSIGFGSVRTATGGYDALAQFRQSAEQIHFIFTDLMMPDLSGFDLSRAIRSEFEELTCCSRMPKANAGATSMGPLAPFSRPVIMALSGAASDEVPHLCFEAGMNGFLTKPVSRMSLYDAAAQFLLYPTLDDADDLSGVTPPTQQSQLQRSPNHSHNSGTSQPQNPPQSHSLSRQQQPPPPLPPSFESLPEELEVVTPHAALSSNRRGRDPPKLVRPNQPNPLAKTSSSEGLLVQPVTSNPLEMLDEVGKEHV